MTSMSWVLILRHDMQDLLIMRGRPYVPEEPEPEPNVLPGSCVAFTCNGELQGVAYRWEANLPCSCQAMHTTLLLICRLLCSEVETENGYSPSRNVGTQLDPSVMC